MAGTTALRAAQEKEQQYEQEVPKVYQPIRF